MPDFGGWKQKTSKERKAELSTPRKTQTQISRGGGSSTSTAHQIQPTPAPSLSLTQAEKYNPLFASHDVRTQVSQSGRSLREVYYEKLSQVAKSKAYSGSPTQQAQKRATEVQKYDTLSRKHGEEFRAETSSQADLKKPTPTGQITQKQTPTKKQDTYNVIYGDRTDQIRVPAGTKLRVVSKAELHKRQDITGFSSSSLLQTQPKKETGLNLGKNLLIPASFIKQPEPQKEQRDTPLRQTFGKVTTLGVRVSDIGEYLGTETAKLGVESVFYTATLGLIKPPTQLKTVAGEIGGGVGLIAASVPSLPLLGAGAIGLIGTDIADIGVERTAKNIQQFLYEVPGRTFQYAQQRPIQAGTIATIGLYSLSRSSVVKSAVKTVKGAKVPKLSFRPKVPIEGKESFVIRQDIFQTTVGSTKTRIATTPSGAVSPTHGLITPLKGQPFRPVSTSGAVSPTQGLIIPSGATKTRTLSIHSGVVSPTHGLITPLKGQPFRPVSTSGILDVKSGISVPASGKPIKLPTVSGIISPQPLPVKPPFDFTKILSIGSKGTINPSAIQIQKVVFKPSNIYKTAVTGKFGSAMKIVPITTPSTVSFIPPFAKLVKDKSKSGNLDMLISKRKTSVFQTPTEKRKRLTLQKIEEREKTKTPIKLNLENIMPITETFKIQPTPTKPRRRTIPITSILYPISTPSPTIPKRPTRPTTPQIPISFIPIPLLKLERKGKKKKKKKKFIPNIVLKGIWKPSAIGILTGKKKKKKKKYTAGFEVRGF